MTDALLAIDVQGIERARPLAATVLYVDGEAARELAMRLARRLGPVDDAIDARVLGVASRDRGYLVLTGPTESLPWIDGARYFGVDPDAPRLRLSTTRGPALRDGTSLAASLLERALIAKLASEQVTGPLVVMRRRVIPLGLARPLDRALLEAFAAPDTAPAEPPA